MPYGWFVSHALRMVCVTCCVSYAICEVCVTCLVGGLCDKPSVWCVRHAVWMVCVTNRLGAGIPSEWFV